MSKVTVLVVEDEAIVAADLAGKLRQLGYEVSGIASEGEEAVALAAQSRPDLVLMDISLAGAMDGIEAAEAIRDRHDVPLVYLTALSDTATLDRAKLTGPFGYILKPFEERDLATQIELALYKHRADREIKEQREWLKVTLTSIGDAVIATDAEGRITFVNPVAEALTGWKGEEAVGQPVTSVFRVVNERTGEPLEEPVGRVLREGRMVPLANHAALVTRDGRTVPIEDSASPILDAQGRLLGAVLVFHDVTEKRRAEEALRHSEERLRFQRERMPIGCVVHDDELRFVEINPAAERIFGYKSEELIGQNVRVIVPPEARPHVDGILRRLAAGDMTAHSVNENLTRDGRIILCDWLNTPLKDSDGKFLGLLSMVQDVTERNKAEEALRQSEAHFRALAEALPQIVWTSDAEGGVEWFNQRWYVYTGEAQGVGEGWNWDRVAHPDDMGHTLQNWQEARQRGELFENEIRIRRHDGQYRWFLVRAWPLKNASGDVVRWVGTNTDIQDLKEAEHRLERENREIALINRTLRVFAETSDDELFDRVLEITQEGLASRHGVFGYIEKPGHLVCPSLSKMLDECETEGKCIHYPREKWKGLWARALIEKRSLCSNKPSAVPAGHPVIQNNLAAPILFRGEVIGLLNLANKDGGYTDTDRLLLEGMADRIASLLYAWIQKKLRQNEQDEARAALREANERYELVLTGSGAAIWDWDVPRRKVMYSQRWKAMRGFKEHEVTDSEDEWSRGIHPEDASRVMAAVQAHFEGKAAFFDEEYRVRRKDGSWLWIADRGLARRDADGRVLRMAGSEIDITVRKQAEAELRAAGELARQRLLEIEDIYHNAPVGLCVLDPELRFVRINERLAEINGLPAAEHVGKTVRDLMPELADTVEPELRRVLESGEPRLNVEIVGETPAQPGVKRSWLEQWLPVTDAHGQVVGLSVVVEETTERMRLLGELERSRDELETRVETRTAELAQAYDHLQETARALAGSEERLRRNNELLQKVFDGISDPLLMLDGSGLVTMINRAGVSYYGVGEEAHVLGKPCFDGLAGREAPCPECAHPFLTSGTRTMSFERSGLKEPGKIENVTVYPVLDEEGRREAVIVRTCDITQAKILEKQILQNEKLAALGLVTSGIAHEINNPNSFIYFNLPILRSYLEALMPIVDEHAARHPEFEVLHMSYAELKEDIFKLVENMEHGSQRISRIIGVLKSFVRKRDVEGLQRVDLKQLADRVVALCQTELKQKLSSFEILVPDDLPSIVSDPDALEQVLLNLLVNAIHACDKRDSHVILKVEGARSGKDQITIEITDNGSGIDEAVRERIFDPFFTTKAPNKGTGLGLYICHNHVTSLGGRIEVESKVGHGSTFRVVLPLEGQGRLEEVPAGSAQRDS